MRIVQRAGKTAALCGVLCLGAPACGRPYAAYDGPRRHAPEVAVVEGQLVRVDESFFQNPKDSVEVLPGDHRLVLFVNYVLSTAPTIGVRLRAWCGLSIRAEGGHTYALLATARDNLEDRSHPYRAEWQAWLEDSSDKKRFRCECISDASGAWPTGSCAERYGSVR